MAHVTVIERTIKISVRYDQIKESLDDVYKQLRIVYPEYSVSPTSQQERFGNDPGKDLVAGSFTLVSLIVRSSDL